MNTIIHTNILHLREAHAPSLIIFAKVIVGIITLQCIVKPTSQCDLAIPFTVAQCWHFLTGEG
jgi:hypothetical protein